MRYQLLDYYKQPFEFSNQDYQNAIAQLLVQGDLTKKDNQLLLTLQGEQTLNDFNMTHKTLSNPALFQRLDIKKWSQRLLLAIQVTSELSHHNAHYLVSINDFQTQFIIKKWLHQQDKTRVATLMYQSLHTFLSQEDPKQAWIFCQQLIGHDFVGQTRQQLAFTEGISQQDVQLIWWDLAGRYALFLAQHYPHFAKDLLADILSDSFLPSSVLQTKKMLAQGFSLEKIAQFRQLKLSTVKEHILSLAILEPNFDVKPFFMPGNFTALDRLLQGDIDQWDYALIQQKMPNLSFFEFRLFSIERSQHEFRQVKS